MSHTQYTLSVTATDAESTDPFELLLEVRTETNGNGILLATARATSGVSLFILVNDPYLTPGVQNTRYLRTYDGAANATDTSFLVEGKYANPDEALAASLITVNYLFEWRDHRYNFVSDLTPSIISASIELQNDRVVARTATFIMDQAQFPVGFDPDRDHIAVSAYFTQAGSPEIFHLGLFSLDTGEELIEPTSVPTDDNSTPTLQITVSATGADVISHLASTTISTPYTVVAGTNYMSAVIALIETVTFKDFTGSVMSMRYALPTEDVYQELVTDQTYDPGTPIIQIINELLQGIAYFPLWADGQGVLRTRRMPYPYEVFPDYVYTTESEPRMVIKPFSKQRNKGQHVNRVVMIMDDPKRNPLSVARENVDPMCPLSVVNVNAIQEEISDALFYDEGSMERVGDFYLAREHSLAYPAVLLTMFDPRRENREYYSLKIAGVEDLTTWYVHGWSISMDVGSVMRHSIGPIMDMTIEDAAV